MPPKRETRRRPGSGPAASRGQAPAGSPEDPQEGKTGLPVTAAQLIKVGGGAALAWLNPRDIVWPDVRITSQYKDEEAEALSLSIQEVGQQQPLGVWLVDGQYIGSDGQNRCNDAIKRGESLVLCIVREGSGAQVLQSNIATALLRGHTNPLSVVKTLWSAYNQEGVDIDDLVQSSGRSAEWVEKMLQIAQASAAVKQALGEEMIALGHAELLSQVEKQEDQEEALRQVLEHRWTVAELDAYLHGQAPVQESVPERSSEPRARSARTCGICHSQQEGEDIQAMPVCNQCAAKVGQLAAIRQALPELREAEQMLAGIQEGAPLAQRLSGILDLLEAGDGK